MDDGRPLPGRRRHLGDFYPGLDPPGSDPQGVDRQLANDIKDLLDAYNNLDCSEVPVDPGDGDGGGGDPGGGACARSPGFWKTHPADWPAQELTLGGVVYGAVEIQELLEYGGPDAANQLARQLVAAHFNLLAGTDPSIQPVVGAADAFLIAHPPGSRPRGQDQQQANDLEDQLESYNNAPCPGED